MSDYFNEREEKRMTGTPEGVPVLAGPAEHVGRGPQSPPPSEVESEAPAVQPEEEESPGAGPAVPGAECLATRAGSRSNLRIEL